MIWLLILLKLFNKSLLTECESDDAIEDIDRTVTLKMVEKP